MAGFATSATHHHIVMAMFVVVVCYASGIMAQDIAPSPAMDAGAGLTLPISAFDIVVSVAKVIVLWSSSIGDGLVPLYLASQELRLKFSLTRIHMFLVYCSLVVVWMAESRHVIVIGCLSL
ncbi:hypothetical protein V6N13_025563 [Hibiscus sabdariffa]